MNIAGVVQSTHPPPILARKPLRRVAHWTARLIYMSTGGKDSQQAEELGSQHPPISFPIVSMNEPSQFERAAAERQSR